MPRATEQDLHDELLSFYRRTGEATGYYAHYFLRELRRHGGMAVARKLLRASNVSSGFERLVAARRADLSIESIALSSRYTHLFSAEERAVARARLATLPPEAFPVPSDAPPPAVTDVPPGTYEEGAIARVTVNQYERDERARDACIRHHGYRCAVCDMDFAERYGEIGKEFIHVHHKRPLASRGGRYRLDPKKDLVPVCPNCHAMLHRRSPPFDVEQLRAELRSA